MSDFQATMFFDVGPLVPPGVSDVLLPFAVAVRPPSIVLVKISDDLEPTRAQIKVGVDLMDPEN